MTHDRIPIIKASALAKRYHTGKQLITAFKDLNLSVFPGQTLGLVGESGCGKSSVAKTLLKLIEPSEGSLFFDGKDITGLSNSDMKPLRRRMQIIFQNPYSSLNPRMTVENIIGEPLEIHALASGKEKLQRIEELLDLVKLDPGHIRRYPHEFSGGQRQRIGIARALAVDPRFIVCDEPLSALDAATQVQIVVLLKRLQRERNLAYLFITHDLSMLEGFADHVCVMYFGMPMELGPCGSIMHQPVHPYTQALISAIPIPDPIQERRRSRIVLKGDLPSPLSPPSGCPFHTRCPAAMPKCKQVKPLWQEVRPGHFAACHLLDTQVRN